MKSVLEKSRYWIIGLAGVALYLWAAQQQATHVNTDRTAYDQSAYMNFSQEVHASGYSYTSGRNRMPLYPTLMSLFYQEGLSNEAYFERGKSIGIALGLLAFFITFLTLRIGTDTKSALPPSLIALISVFTFKAPYFQTEILFYTLSFLLFVSVYRLIQHPHWLLAIAAGITAGLGHLTKASVLPCVVLGSFILMFLGLYSLKKRHNNNNNNTESSPFSWKRSHLLCSLLLLISFLSIIFPYINKSKEMTGHYFYNVNSTFYMWYDSWDEVKEGTRAYGDRFSWPDMPEKEIPSPLKYLQEHSIKEIAQRLLNGATQTLGVGFITTGYSYFILLYSALIAVILKRNWGSIKNHFTQKTYCLLTFIAAYFTGYFLLYSWYAPIAVGNRFVLSLFLPALFLITKTLSFLELFSSELSQIGRAGRPGTPQCLQSTASNYEKNSQESPNLPQPSPTKLTPATISTTLLYTLALYSLAILPFLSSRVDGGH